MKRHFFLIIIIFIISGIVSVVCAQQRSQQGVFPKKKTTAADEKKIKDNETESLLNKSSLNKPDTTGNKSSAGKNKNPLLKKNDEEEEKETILKPVPGEPDKYVDEKGNVITIQKQEKVNPNVNKDSWIVGMVDTRILLKKEFDLEIAKLMSSAPEDKGSEEYAERKRVYEQKFLDDWVKVALYAEHAKSKGISVTDAELDSRLNQILSETAETDLAGKLSQLGVSEKQFKDQLRDALLTEKIFRVEIENRLGEATIKEWYQKKPELFQPQPMVRVSQIYLKFAKTDLPAEREKKKDQLKSIRKEVKGDPVKFAEYAEKFSEDIVAKNNKGDLGWQNPYNMLPEPVNTKIFEMEKNEVSDVIESKFGFHLLLITDKVEPKEQTYEQAKPMIVDYLYQHVEDGLYKEFMKEHKIVKNPSGIDPEKLNRKNDSIEKINTAPKTPSSLTIDKPSVTPKK